MPPNFHPLFELFLQVTGVGVCLGFPVVLAAGFLGLRFYSHRSARIARYHILKGAAADLGLKLKPGTAGKSERISGVYAGREVSYHVGYNHQAKTEFTVIEAGHKAELGGRLVLHREDWSDKLSGNMQFMDVTSGSRVFDKKYKIRASNTDVSKKLKSRILESIKSLDMPSILLEDKKVKARMPGQFKDRKHLKKAIEGTVRLAKALEE